MIKIEKSDLPPDALLQTYAAIEGCYTDCFTADIEGAVSLTEFVTAFYTTRLFKLERFILNHVFSKPSTDHQVSELVDGKTDKFAAWRVETRAENQLLMRDNWGKTCSWFMVAPQENENKNATRLYFGTAVIPVRSTKNDKPSIGSTHQAMLGFHKLYSVALLSAARSRLA